MKDLSESASGGRPEGNLPLNVVIAYQDTSTGQRAQRLLDTLTRECGNEGLHSGNSWTFDLLRMPQLRRKASARAAKADLIILALHEDDDVPVEVRQWIESWIPKKARTQSVLFALLDAQDELSANIAASRSYLLAAARRARMQFIMRTHESFDTELCPV